MAHMHGDMRGKIFICSLLFAASVPAAAQTRPVGTWEDHLPYGQGLELVWCGASGDSASDAGFVAVRTPGAVFTFRPEDGTVEKRSKVRSLSAGAPTALFWDAARSTLLVGHADGTVDFVAEDGRRTYTLIDIRESSLIGSKSIRSFTASEDGQQVYAASAFGVVVIDLRTRDVRDTWYPEGSQNRRDVRGVLADGGRLVVWTDAGVFEADAAHPFLGSPDAWTRWEDVPDEQADVRELVWDAEGEPMLHIHTADASPPDALWVLENGLWSPHPTFASNQIQCITTGFTPDGTWRLAVGDFNGVRLYDAAGALVDVDYAAGGVEFRPRDLVLRGRHVWVASAQGGLLRMDLLNEDDGIARAPEGPPVAASRAVDAWNGNVWVASGAVDETWTSRYRKDGPFGRVDGEWVGVPVGAGVNELAGVNDLLCVAIDPRDPAHVYFGSWEEGLVEVREGALVAIHNATNSTLQLGDFGGSPRCGVAGVDFDEAGNLWFTNAFVEHALQVRRADGTFAQMALGSALGSDGWLGDVLAARNGYVWAVMPRGQGLLVYNTAGTLETTADDDWRILTTDPARGGLPSNDVYCVEEDLDGEIWIGTGAGPAVVYVPEAIFSEDASGPWAAQILIAQDGNNQYLLETEAIRCIRIDGGNRKWIGTSTSGAFLMSSDGLQQLAHHTSADSPLPSDAVTGIALNHANGEIYFATEAGIVSLQGDATNFVPAIDDLTVFPNPVRADHAGPIAVDGLAYGSTVHVTTAAGRWISTLMSEGGRAVWDGRDADGRPAPNGVYLFFAADATGRSAGTAKVALMR